MNERIRDFLSVAFVYLIGIPLFWLCYYWDWVYVHVLEIYYKALNIPYYKGRAKFGLYIERLKA